MRKKILDSREVVGMGKYTGTHRYGSFAALPESEIQALAREIAPLHWQNVITRYGSYQKMITQASNRLLRTAARRGRAGGKMNKIQEAAEAAFRVWQYAPGFEGMSGAAQRSVKFLYPFLRFQTDPLFIMMNYTEPAIYNVLNNGWRGVQKGATKQTQRLADLASEPLIPAGGLYSERVSADLLLADPGFYTLPKNIRPHILREFQELTGKKAEQLFQALGKDHPVAVVMRERFGDNVKDWAVEANRMLANMAEKGPDKALREVWTKTLEKEIGLSVAEMKQLVPVYERLSETYRGIYSDLANLYIGRMNRSNLERLANSFFVMWPASYMVKVTTWAYRVLMEKLGPVEGSAGAFLWDTYRQRYEDKYENDASFRQFVDENEDFLFAAEMILPVSPSNISVGVNRTTRYAGSWFLQEQGLGGSDLQKTLTGEYAPESIPELLSGSLRFGPIRTAKLVTDVLEKWEVPGFYTGGGYKPYEPLPN
jgi:hypothetical protein